VNEDRWLGTYWPERLVSGVYGQWGARDNRNERYDPERLRLFACACLRRLWDLLDDEHRQVVELLEKHARLPRVGGLARVRQVYRDAARRLAQEWVDLWDASWDVRWVLRGLATDRHAYFAWHTMTGIAGPGRAELPRRLEVTARLRAASAVWRAAENKATTAALACTRASAAVAFREEWERARQGGQPFPERIARSNAEAAAQCVLFRDIYRRPSAPPLKVSKAVLAWRDGTVAKLARDIDRTQDWSRLPILADALEECGGAGPELIEHCRSAGPHVRGCWAVDVLLKRPIC
jgi:hypothetical protein